MTILDLSATSLLSPQLDHSRSNKMSTPPLPSPSHTNKAEKNSIQLRRISIRQSESSVWLACAFHYQIWWLEYLGEETNSKLLLIRIHLFWILSDRSIVMVNLHPCSLRIHISQIDRTAAAQPLPYNRIKRSHSRNTGNDPFHAKTQQHQ